jgi:LPXTG-motif cell wall-anchored protein
MGKWFGAAASAVVLAAVAAGPGAAGGADHKMGAMCSPSGTSLALTAENHAFDKDCLAVTAGQAFTIRFENRDADRHNVAILPSHTSTETIFQGDIVPGPKNTVYAVPNMKAGTYHFHCEVHPNLMQGTFIVAAAPTPTTSAKPSATPSPTMSMGADTPAAQPAPAPKAGSSPPRAAAAAPAPSAAPSAAAGGSPAAAPKTAAAAGNNLPHTGPASSRLLLLLAGLALAAGGLSVLGGARPAASKG